MFLCGKLNIKLNFNKIDMPEEFETNLVFFKAQFLFSGCLKPLGGLLDHLIKTVTE